MKNNKLMLRIFAGITTVFVAVGSAKAAKADTAKANEKLEKYKIVFNKDDSKNTNLVVNSKDVLREVVQTGNIPVEYEDSIISPELTLSSYNQMCENVINKNCETLFNEPESFEYLSLGEAYMDNEEEAAILANLASIIERFASAPTEEGLQEVLDFIRVNSAVLSIGAKKAIMSDLFFVSAIAQVYEIESDQLTAMVDSYGENGDIITYINAITGNQKCLR